MTKNVSMAQAKGSLSELASRAAAGERFLLLRRGRPLAGLVGPRDLACLETTGQATSFGAALDAFRRRHGAALPAPPLAIRRSRGRPLR
jgi:antitoxin (DNA-binding transcriptional repressor) of toxin-antitoxin stability system